MLRAQIFILSFGDHLLLLEYIYKADADKSLGVNAGAIYHVWFPARQDLNFCSSERSGRKEAIAEGSANFSPTCKLIHINWKLSRGDFSLNVVLHSG